MIRELKDQYENHIEDQEKGDLERLKDTIDGNFEKGKPSCDNKDCKAVLEPKTLEEYKDTLEHYQKHSYLGGCSHGN